MIVEKKRSTARIRSEKLLAYNSIRTKTTFLIIYEGGSRINDHKMRFYFSHVINTCISFSISRILYLFFFLFTFLPSFISRYKLDVIFVAATFSVTFLRALVRTCLSELPSLRLLHEPDVPDFLISRLDGCLCECQKLTDCFAVQYCTTVLPRKILYWLPR